MPILWLVTRADTVRDWIGVVSTRKVSIVEYSKYVNRVDTVIEYGSVLCR